jgi:predicted enzyme related to lactoylglutathione lyase
MPGTATLTTVVVDCADPASLAAFYRNVTGWEVTYSDDDFVYLGGGPVQLGFQRVAGYRAPVWPQEPKNAHLDFKVADLERAAAAFVAAGATRPEFQPGKGEWVVLADPEGHVFCLTPGDASA